MNYVWIIVCGEGTDDFLIDWDHGVLGTPEDALQALIETVEENKGAVPGDSEITLRDVPMIPGDRFGVITRGLDIALHCCQVNSGLRAARLRLRKEELEREIADIEAQLGAKQNEASRIKEELEG